MAKAKWIDYMVPLVTESTTFTVDTTGPLFVNTVNAAPTVDMTLYSAFGGGTYRSWFKQGHNFIITQIGINVASPFQIYTEAAGTDKNPAYNIGARRHSTGVTDKFFTYGIFVPLLNQSMHMDRFCDVGEIVGEEFQLTMKLLDNISISMIGVDPLLNGKVFHVIPWLQIEMNSNIRKYWDH